MASWSAGQYLRFADERTQPCRDLASRIAVADVRRVIDLGCGPGNSTEVLAARWPSAAISGSDNSAEMLKAARESHPDWDWQHADIADWAEGSGEPYDVVFSNAALHWVPAHDVVLPKLLSRVAQGGALAVQMPAYDSPAHRVSRELALTARWKHRFPNGVAGDWHAHEVDFYYDVVAPHASRVDLWETSYQHVMESRSGIVEWYKGTGLRPFLAALPDPVERDRFLAEYLHGLEEVYPTRANGRVLFPFRRIFFIAYVEAPS
jgi:trans-aconitate 2-methyltransferase